MNIKHFLYKTGDLDAPESILDRNGEVVLDLCRLCGKGEADLGEFCDGSLQERLDAALSALDRMTDQRDQLAVQLKDATAQLARAGDLLRKVREWATTLGVARDFGGLMVGIEGYLAGEVMPPARDAWLMASRHWKEELVSILGPSGLIASGLTVKQASALIEAHGGVDTSVMAAPKPEGQ